MKKSILWTVIITAVLMTTMGAYGTSFWPQSKGNAGHTGLVPHSIGCKNTTEWTLELPNGGPFLVGSMLDGNDNFIALGTGGGLYSVSPSGSINWSLQGLGSGNWGGIAYSDSNDTIYAACYSKNPDFYAIDASNGQILWSFNGSAGSDSAPVIGPDGTIYYTTYANPNPVFALTDNGTSGTLKWSLQTPFNGYTCGATPLYNDGTNNFIFHATEGVNAVGENNVLCVRDDTTQGTIMWCRQVGYNWAEGSVDDDGNYYIACFGDRIATIPYTVFKFDLAGNLLWQVLPQDGTVTFSTVAGSPTFSADGSRLYVGSHSDRLWCLSTADGSLIWVKQLESDNLDEIVAPPIVLQDGTIYAIRGHGAFALFRLWDAGTLPVPIFKYALPSDTTGAPAPNADGSLYVIAEGSLLQKFAPEPATVEIITTSCPDAPPFVPYSTFVAAWGGVRPYTWSVTAGALPTGMTINAATGEISGTCNAPAIYNFTVQAVDSAGSPSSDTQALSIAVVPPPPDLVDKALLKGGRNFYYKDTISVSTGGWLPFAYTLDSGSLPPGLSLAASTGIIDGTPTAVGIYTFNVKVTDGWTPARTDVAVFSIQIVDMKLDIITLSVHNGQVNVPYQSTTFKYAASSTTAKTWSQPGGTLPPGLALAPAGIDYVLSGTPTTAGSYFFSIKVTDGTETQINAYTVLIDTNPSAFGNWKRVANNPNTFPYPDWNAGELVLTGTLTLYPSTPSAPWDNRVHPTMHNAVANANGKIISCGGWAAHYNVAGTPNLDVTNTVTTNVYWGNRQGTLGIYSPATDTWDSAYWHDWFALGFTNGYPANGQPTGYNNPHDGVSATAGGTRKPTVGQGIYSGANSACALDIDNDGTEEYFIFLGYPIWTERPGIWDPDTNSWSTTSLMTGLAGEQTSHNVASVKDGKIYFLAGSGATNQFTFMIYDAATDVWTNKGKLAGDYAKQYGCAEIIGNEWIITGGNNAKTVIYDIPSDTWLPYNAAWDIPANYGCRFSPSFVYNGKMYIMGGLTDTDTARYRSMAYFDPATRTWTTLADQTPYGINGSGGAIVGDTFYLSYGRKRVWDGAAFTNTVINETFAYKLAPEPVKPVITDVERTASIKITWQSVAGATYRVESSVSPYDPTYNEALMTWTNEVTGLASGGTTTSWTDTAVAAEKYYRVYTEVPAGDLKADDTVGQMTIAIKQGRNMVSSPFEPYPVGGGTPGASTLDKIVGNQLTGHAFNKAQSDTIEIWLNASAQYKRAWFDNSPLPGTWVDWDVVAPPAFGMDADKGYWFNIIGAHPAKNVIFCGRVSKASRSIPIAKNRNLVGSCFPVSCTLAKSGLVASGFTGHAFNKAQSDNVEFWKNPGAVYERFWFDNSPLPGSWQPWNVGDPMRDIMPGDGIWVNLLPSRLGFTWSYPVPPRP